MNPFKRVEAKEFYREAFLEVAGAAQPHQHYIDPALAALAAALGIIDILVGQGGPAGTGSLAGTARSATVFFGRRHSAAGPREGALALEAAAGLLDQAGGEAIIIERGLHLVQVRAKDGASLDFSWPADGPAEEVLRPALTAARCAAELIRPLAVGRWAPSGWESAQAFLEPLPAPKGAPELAAGRLELILPAGQKVIVEAWAGGPPA